MHGIKIFKATFTRNDFLILLLIFPYHILIQYLLLGNAYFTNTHLFLVGTAVAICMWPASWYVHTLVGFKVRNRFPEIKQTTIRVTLSLCSFILVSFLQNSLLIFLYSYSHFFGYSYSTLGTTAAYICGLNINVIATGFFETSYLINKWKSFIVEAEGLKKAQVQSELDNLKSQVNPHFLFNSINSLSSLINEDAVKAEKFLQEMSKVYRYLLQNNDQELTPLYIELDFINSYFHLLKTRYEDGITMTIAIDTKYYQYLLPPLTLQMLIENAVKHNAIFEKSPLSINLRITAEEKLTVSNNKQRKTTAIESNKIGLKNIKAKYKLLKQDEVVVEETDHIFAVTVPLVKTEES
ncbi:MAG: histidine kinase [Bacteroidota bacterium]